MKNKGFTLMEVIGAMVILGIGLVAILGMFSLGNKDLISREEELKGINVLQRKMEEIKCKDYDSVVTENSALCYGYPLAECHFDVNVAACGDPLLNLKKVDLTIYLNTSGGGSWQRTISTLIGDRS